MPELPDVEGYRRALAAALPGHRIVRTEVRDAGVLRNRTAEQFTQQLIGRRFGDPTRLGKWLVLPTDGPSVLVHSGITGRVYIAGSGDESGRHDRVVLTTDGPQVRYADLRKLGGIWLATDDEELAGLLGGQGPDASGVSRSEFVAALRNRRGALKSALMDQSAVAGLGNMLSDEICWRARVHPASPIAGLSDGDLVELWRQLTVVLRAAVRAGHIPRTRTWLNSFRAAPDPAPCPRCTTAVRRTRIGGRTSLWCPHCQPERG